MSRIDEGIQLTDELLQRLEKRIRKVYSEAGQEMQEQLDKYFQQFAADDAEMSKKLDDGEITGAEYRKWRYAEMARGEDYKALRDELAKRLTNAKSIAYSYINDTTPTIYTLNRNYAAYSA